MINRLISLPYEVARYPLAIADEKLTGRLPETLGQRLDQALGSADMLAGSLLRNPDLAQRGVDRVDRATKLLDAARLEHQADARREQARETAKTGLEEADRKREAARERVASGFDEADEVEARGKQEAKERSSKTAASKKTAAEKRAESQKSAAERRKEQVTSIAEAKQKTAQQRAKEELDEARDGQQSADEARADAERLSELTEAKKKQRK